MIYRVSFRAQAKEGALPELKQRLAQRFPEPRALLRDEALLTASLFSWERQLFWYAEGKGAVRHPATLFSDWSDLLDTWPGEKEPRLWIPMIDAFYFNAPESEEQWARPEPVQDRIGKVAFLRPEMIPSYLFYHYQLQEERAFAGEKYKYISMHENLLFMYDERPTRLELPTKPGKLDSHNTPKDWTGVTRMDLHFIPWNEKELFFRRVDTLLSV